ncbi:uncharacterized protein CTRU02_212483 [Colletotrichum truncatum]|uniref:Uncharacterized protein n=1 Tax=Colletotrichum truncatum TaxID=5467 RepID=A0ACC3YNN3_COLTU|nr:uncharacterized protein CTRU02_05708 [Colletotrichum truncatum]KAF6794151.1 hypothetical protein CTRU02_05708 [Colletotrichum truncatum]
MGRVGQTLSYWVKYCLIALASYAFWRGIHRSGMAVVQMAHKLRLGESAYRSEWLWTE